MSFSWSRLALLFGACLAAAAAAAQDYGGTWYARNSAGTLITFTLKPEGPGGFSGTLEGSGHRFDVAGEIRADGILGLVTSEQALVHLAGRLDQGTLFVVLREPGPGGEPDERTRRVIRFARADPGAPAKPAQREQLALLLMQSPWCSLDPRTPERMVFRKDGVVERGGRTSRWQVRGGALEISQDGASWTQQPLAVRDNPDGWPIIDAGGREFSQCD